MSNGLSILYIVDPSIAVTGAFVAARNAAKALTGQARVVLVLPIGSAIPPEELTDFWRIDHIPMGRLSKNPWALLTYVPSLARGAWQLRQRMQRDGATTLQLNDFYLMQGALLRVGGFSGQIVSFVRCEPSRFAGPLAPLLLAVMKRTSNRVVAVSQHIRRLLPAATATDMLYDYYAGPVRASKQWSTSDEKRFVFVGNYIEGKGQDMALAAFMPIAAEHANVTLYFYGGDMGLAKNAAYRRSLERWVADHQLTARVKFHDLVRDTYPVLEPAYAALNFSGSESFSMTVLEASGAGLPVIATASGGPQEIIRDGETGYIVPVGDVAAASARMRQLVEDSEAANRMGQAGAAYVKGEFSRASFTEQLRHILALG